MSDRWYREAVIYCLDVETFQDSDGDGVGDLPGLISRLDYLERLGVNCLWLNPIHPTPNRDDGYDVSDFYGVDPRLGNLGDFVELIHQAANRGLRVMIDLVVNHTSDQHPWFQAARSDPKSPFRDYYVWSEERPSDLHQGMVFPGVQKATWTFDRTAKAWYYHRFYDFEPELNAANPRVRAEVEKIIAFWLQLGVAGFRMDAAPFVIELSEPGNPDPPKDFDYLRQLRELMSWRRGDTLVLAEANAEPQELTEYFGDGNRLPMLFNFLLNQQMFLGMARGDAGPVLNGLSMTPTIPETCAWATFLRNHDEIDLGRLTGVERAEVFEAFGPEPEMQLYDRGIRRRLAPMLGGDRRRVEMAYALQFSLPGTPVVRYGEEIGMGDDLSLPERNAVRTPMQWSDAPNAGFSTAPEKDLARPVIDEGRFGYRKVNVAAERRDPDSLLSWMERTLHTLHECPEFGTGTGKPLDSGIRSVLALRYEGPTGVMLALTNLADDPCVVDLADQLGDLPEPPTEVLSDTDYGATHPNPAKLELNGYGYRWIRLARSMGATY
ncbi:MAG: maltose alpha-D-glucosyltransferase / alpha-amylase [Actinomycetota bacterium]|nr:maltose alpha-D-glucosyltransferase / alpha-amylase [Actinomycetota bacterium]